VSHVLEGSVRKSGDRSARDGAIDQRGGWIPPWSSSYDRQLTEVFAVQDEIAAAVVDALQVKLLPEQQAARTHHRPGPEAYDQYLLGRHCLSTRSGDFVPAVEAFSRASRWNRITPWPYAYLGMAESFVSESTKGDAAKADAARARARGRGRQGGAARSGPGRRLLDARLPALHARLGLERRPRPISSSR
jgi:adenylate cyclase